MMRAVLDTNVATSAYLWGGTAMRLLHMAGLGKIQLFTSPTLVAELNDELSLAGMSAAPSARRLLPAIAIASYTQAAQFVFPLSILKRNGVPVNPRDKHVVACAVQARADLLVTFDRPLLDIGDYLGIRIVKPHEAARLCGVP